LSAFIFLTSEPEEKGTFQTAGPPARKQGVIHNFGRSKLFMAIIFHGLSQCPLCGKTLTNEAEYISFPAMVSNLKDPMAVFSDAGIHEACITEHPLKEKALHFREACLKIADNLTDFDGKPVDHKDLLNLGLITSDESEELFIFNFTVLNIHSIAGWKDKELFLELVKKFKNEGKWEGIANFDYPDYLIRQIEKNK
jgi:hypothetical protein